MKALKYIRIILAAFMLLGITALVLDTTGLVRHWLGWMPKVQLLPAILALNVVVVVTIVVVTALAGRFYCSVLCPMGIFQDIFTWFHRIIFGKKHKFKYSVPVNGLRYTVLVLFVLCLLLGMNHIAVLIAPYSAYARMVTNIHSTGVAHWVAIATLVVIGLMGFTQGRMWCNTICPIGALLSLFSKHALFGIRIDGNKCVGCRKCEHTCKARCIDIDNKQVDTSRCVNCFNCLEQCNVGAIGFSRRASGTSITSDSSSTSGVDASRRKFLTTTAAVGTAALLHAQEQKLDGGLAVIADKKVPQRTHTLHPAGSISQKNFESRCTSCQLCVSQCPEQVLRPSSELGHLLQPYMAFDKGYCRPACTRCSQLCPTGAIKPVTKEEKTAISIGTAVVLKDNCIGCGACARHCPAGAIIMANGIPAVNESKCIGCGACEYYCPARPMTAIFVEGRSLHAEI